MARYPSLIATTLKVKPGCHGIAVEDLNVKDYDRNSPILSFFSPASTTSPMSHPSQPPPPPPSSLSQHRGSEAQATTTTMQRRTLLITDKFGNPIDLSKEKPAPSQAQKDAEEKAAALARAEEEQCAVLSTLSSKVSFCGGLRGFSILWQRCDTCFREPIVGTFYADSTTLSHDDGGSCSFQRVKCRRCMNEHPNPKTLKWVCYEPSSLFSRFSHIIDASFKAENENIQLKIDYGGNVQVRIINLWTICNNPFGCEFSIEQLRSVAAQFIHDHEDKGPCHDAFDKAKITYFEKDGVEITISTDDELEGAVLRFFRESKCTTIVPRESLFVTVTVPGTTKSPSSDDYEEPAPCLDSRKLKVDNGGDSKPTPSLICTDNIPLSVVQVLRIKVEEIEDIIAKLDLNTPKFSCQDDGYCNENCLTLGQGQSC